MTHWLAAQGLILMMTLSMVWQLLAMEMVGQGTTRTWVVMGVLQNAAV
jgi:hypothetical protein